MQIFVLTIQKYDGSDIQSVSTDINDIKDKLAKLEEVAKEYNEQNYYEFFIYENGVCIHQYTGENAERQISAM